MQVSAAWRRRGTRPARWRLGYAANKAGAFACRVKAHPLAEIGCENRSGDAERCRQPESARPRSRRDDLCDQTCDEADQDRPHQLHTVPVGRSVRVEARDVPRFTKHASAWPELQGVSAGYRKLSLKSTESTCRASPLRNGAFFSGGLENHHRDGAERQPASR